MAGLTSILIVEPDRKTRKALSTALERKGFVVVSAATAAEARRRMRRQKPGLVLLDYGIPAAEARAQELWSSTAVVLLVEREETSFAARSTDAVAVIPKPVDADVVRQVVERHARPAGTRRPSSTRRPVIDVMDPFLSEEDVVPPLPAPDTVAPVRPRLYTAARRARWRWTAAAASRAAREATLRAQQSIRRTRTLLRYSDWVLRVYALRFNDETLARKLAARPML